MSGAGDQSQGSTRTAAEPPHRYSPSVVIQKTRLFRDFRFSAFSPGTFRISKSPGVLRDISRSSQSSKSEEFLGEMLENENAVWGVRNTAHSLEEDAKACLQEISRLPLESTVWREYKKFGFWFPTTAALLKLCDLMCTPHKLP